MVDRCGSIGLNFPSAFRIKDVLTPLPRAWAEYERVSLSRKGEARLNNISSRMNIFVHVIKPFTRYFRLHMHRQSSIMRPICECRIWYFRAEVAGLTCFTRSLFCIKLPRSRWTSISSLTLLRVVKLGHHPSSVMISLHRQPTFKLATCTTPYTVSQNVSPQTYPSLIQIMGSPNLSPSGSQQWCAFLLIRTGL